MHIWLRDRSTPRYMIRWHTRGISGEEKQIKGGNAHQNHYIPTTLPWLHSSTTHLSTHSCLITLTEFASLCFSFSPARTPVTRCSALPPFPGKADRASVASESPRQEHYGYWAPRSASRLCRLRWHRPLFVLALRIKAPFLVSAPSRLFQSLIGENTVSEQQGLPFSREMCQYVRLGGFFSWGQQASWGVFLSDSAPHGSKSTKRISF